MSAIISIDQTADDCKSNLRNDWPHPRRRLFGALPKSGEVGVASGPLPLLIAATEDVTSMGATPMDATSVASDISDSPADLQAAKRFDWSL